MPLSKIKIPNYKLSQELWNSISHGLGALFGIVAYILMILKIVGVYPSVEVIKDKEFVYKIIGVTIYAFGIISCMTISCLYHALKKNNGKKVFRVIDHDFVYVLIGSTYTIYALCTIREKSARNNILPYSGWIVFALVWALIALAISLTSVNMEKFKVVGTILNIVIGWVIILVSDAVLNSVGLNGFLFLLFGGVAYTIGAVLYGIGSKKSPWWHTVFHFFVLFGVILQFISVYLYVL